MRFWPFLGFFEGGRINLERFRTFCDVVRTFFGACCTFLVALFCGFAVHETHFYQNNDVYAVLVPF